jgi:hypothetical protein
MMLYIFKHSSVFNPLEHKHSFLGYIDINKVLYAQEQKSEENCFMRSFIICIPGKNLLKSSNQGE